ncbi:Glutamate receptor ionotropic, kainate 3 [Branchiostoma belcheri]|nr:Glutamate receptor ionotropic, kainate 3 [Branchiostoma belcheri]
MAFFRTCASSADTITIGGLLQRNESQREDLAVRYAISNINSIKSLLPNTRLISNTQQVSSSNSFTAATQASFDSTCDVRGRQNDIQCQTHVSKTATTETYHLLSGNKCLHQAE